MLGLVLYSLLLHRLIVFAKSLTWKFVFWTSSSCVSASRHFRSWRRAHKNNFSSRTLPKLEWKKCIQFILIHNNQLLRQPKVRQKIVGFFSTDELRAGNLVLSFSWSAMYQYNSVYRDPWFVFPACQSAGQKKNICTCWLETSKITVNSSFSMHHWTSASCFLSKFI